ANGEPVDKDNKIDLEARLICDGHFQSLVSNWERSDDRSQNNRQARSKSISSVSKCPLTHQKAVNAENCRIVDRSLTKAAKVSKTTKTPAKTPNSTRANTSVRSPRGGTRKRTVVEESEESAEDEHDLIVDGENEDD
ncbi:hypothetical protein PENTCL1PPCAC_14567, partial [Pristionchus entomophagus]